MIDDEPILSMDFVTKAFPMGNRWRPQTNVAVDNISLDIRPNQTIALVGESGCGKSTLAKILLGLTPPTLGSVKYRGTDLRLLDRQGRRDYRKSVQTVFQDPWSSLNPRMRIWEIVAEPIIANSEVRLSKSSLLSRVAETLESVGLEAGSATNYPHEFSGGQRQRIAIARALISEPEFIILDEPVSGLDISIRAQIMNLLNHLQAERRHSTLMISHSLADVRYLSESILVMYRGQIVESGPSSEVLAMRSSSGEGRPNHPYTKALISASLMTRDESAPRIPDPTAEGLVGGGLGCSFKDRCPSSRAECLVSAPSVYAVGASHGVSCFLYKDSTHVEAREQDHG